jgi:hypothetical protein
VTSASGGDRLLVELPRLADVRQQRSTPTLANVAETLRDQLKRLGLTERLRPGQSVAITAGSRGIRDIAVVIRTLAEELRSCGARPFVVPAMGSHGGATAEGQLRLLADLGVSEASVGVPIRSSMEVVQVDTAAVAAGMPIWFDRFAAEADHVVVVNRVKPHTDFCGPIQSGLLKMMLIGLGKHRGALEYHRVFRRYGFDQIVGDVGPRIVRACRVLCGVAIVENHRHETGRVEVVEPTAFAQREVALLRLAQSWMPRLPFDPIDLLIVDRMGKEISGSGMDTNVIGRKGWSTGDFFEQRPRIGRIYVRDLSEASHGNAIGIGLADVAHSRLIQKIDFPATYTNALTSGTPRGASVPPHFPTDREALAAALQSLGTADLRQARIVRIRDTLDLNRLLISEGLLAEARDNPELEVDEEPQPLRFDAAGDLPEF